MKKQMQVALLLAISAMTLTSAVQAAIRVDGDPPFYAIILKTADGNQEIYHDDEWAAIPFFRDPACVPEDFNLLELFDFTPAFPDGPPRPFLCPLTVDGFEIWENGPGLDPAPIQFHVKGLGAVPVWFVSWPALQLLIADNSLTIAELASMPSLKIGSATFYTFENIPGDPPSMESVNAAGKLANGTRFQFHAAVVVQTTPFVCCSSDGKMQQVIIRFW
jgi:hypothetical protein